MAPERSDRELWRSLEQADPDPEEPDEADIWEAALNEKHPDDMSTPAEADALRKLHVTLSNHIDGSQATAEDIDQASPEEIAEFDAALRRTLSDDDEENGEE